MPRPKPSRPESAGDRIEWWPIDRLTPSPRNTRTHSPEQVGQLRKSLRRFKWTRPIMALPSGRIIVGHGLLEAARAEGFTVAKVMVLDGMSEADARAYLIADNQLALTAGWDEDLLREELLALASEDWDLDALGFSDLDLRKFLADMSGEGSASAGSGALAARFGIPPFSVFNAREGWWQERKAAWLSIGIRSELGRGEMAVDRGASAPARQEDAAEAQRRFKLSSPGGSPMPNMTGGYHKDRRGRVVK